MVQVDRVDKLYITEISAIEGRIVCIIEICSARGTRYVLPPDMCYMSSSEGTGIDREL